MWRIVKRVSKGDYDYALVPNHPNSTANGYVLYHRIVMENFLGRMLSNGEEIHHKNRNKKDNRIENLELLTSLEHRKLHGKETPRTLVEFKCPNCLKLFVREKRNSLDKYKSIGKLFFCGKSCSSLYQFNRSKVEMMASEN